MIWLVLAACAGPGTATPPASSPAPAPDPAVAAPTTPPTHVRARVGIENGSWTDIAVEGTDEDAVFFCTELVAREVGPLLNVRVLRDCATEPLPSPPHSAVQLVAFERVTFEDLILVNLVARSKATVMPPATLHRVAPFDDRFACEAMLVRIDAEDQRARIEAQQSVAKLLDDELQRAIADQAPACKDALAAEQRCAALRGDKQAVCELDADRKRRLCDQYTAQREVLEARRAKPLPAPRSVQRTCRVP